MRARAKTAMPPNDDRGGDACESDRIAPDARQTDSDPLFAFAVEPIPSNEKLERFASYTDALRDALGELRRVKELSPDEAAERGCLSTLRSLHRRGHAELTADLCASAARGGQFEVLEWSRERMPVGLSDVRGSGEARPPRGAEVGARERLPVGRGYVRVRGGGRPPRGAEMVARERLSVG